MENFRNLEKSFKVQNIGNKRLDIKKIGNTNRKECNRWNYGTQKNIQKMFGFL